MNVVQKKYNACVAKHNLTHPLSLCYNASGTFGFPAGRKQMALGFSPLNTKVEGGEIMSDFEIISVVIMIASLVLKAIKFGRDTKNKKKK